MVEILSIRHFVGEDHIEDGLAIRQEVFTKERRVPIEIEQDDFDNQSEHYIGYLNDEPVVVARVRLGSPNRTSATLDRLAVVSENRRRGLGSQIIDYIIADLSLREFAAVNLDAPSYLVEYCRRFGFIATGSEYVDSMGVTNRPMYRTLDKSEYKLP